MKQRKDRNKKNKKKNKKSYHPCIGSTLPGSAQPAGAWACQAQASCQAQPRCLTLLQQITNL